MQRAICVKSPFSQSALLAFIRVPPKNATVPHQAAVGLLYGCCSGTARLFLRRHGAESEEQHHAEGMIAVDRIERRGFSVQSDLTTEGGGNVRHERELAVVAEGVSLNASEKMFFEIYGLGIFAVQQFVGAVHVFDARPGVIVAQEAQRRFPRGRNYKFRRRAASCCGPRSAWWRSSPIARRRRRRAACCR